MVKTGKSITDLMNDAEIFYTELTYKTNVLDALKSKIHDAGVSENEKKFYSEIEKKFKKIITGTPKELELLVKEIKPLYEKVREDRVSTVTSKADIDKKTKEWKDEVLSLLKYKTFTSKSNTSWAYKHSKRHCINVCLYCNMQYTITISDKKGKTRPHFDHFMSQKDFPYLSMSFFNLIPCCYICNSNLKGLKSFNVKENIHPLIEGTQDTIVFTTGVEKISYLAGKKDFHIKLQSTGYADPEKFKRAENNCNIFKIVELYDFHKDYVGEIINKAYMYDDSKINGLLTSFNTLFNSDKEVIQTLFSNYISDDNLHKRPLAKLANDILSELKKSDGL